MFSQCIYCFSFLLTSFIVLSLYVRSQLDQPNTKRKMQLFLTSTILIAKIRKPPYIPQSHSEAKTRQEKLNLAAPSCPLNCILHISCSLTMPHPANYNLCFAMVFLQGNKIIPFAPLILIILVILHIYSCVCTWSVTQWV